MRKSLTLIMVLISPLLLFAQTNSFFVNGKDGRDMVKFTSKAPMETVEGTTSMIKGYLNVSPDNIISAEARFVVDLAGLKTGIDLRDNHMRDNHLETDTYPEAEFVLNEVVSDTPDISDGQPHEITLKGDFTCHGVTKPTEIKTTVQYFAEQSACPEKLPGQSIHVHAFFDVYLADHEIKRPKFLVLKLDEKQAIELDFWASTGLTEVMFNR